MDWVGDFGLHYDLSAKVLCLKKGNGLIIIVFKMTPISGMAP